MNINTNALVAMTEANQNFSKVVRTVDEEGAAVILKNNKPKYIVVKFDEYEDIRIGLEKRRLEIDDIADNIISANMDALKELAKWYY